jgi:hypothetical protein
MLRRPPTAIALAPSDVAELQAFILNRNATAAAQGLTTTSEGTQSQGIGNDSNVMMEESVDDLLEREEKERKEKSGRTRNERIGVA